MKNNLFIFAGPCSIDRSNIEDIYKIADIKINNKPTIFGTRIVGLKSRTVLNKVGEGMGIDYQTLMDNYNILLQGGNLDNLKIPESIKIAKQIIKDTNLVIATEIMMPLLQLPPMIKELPNEKVMLWNPSVNQLGWPIMQTSKIAKSKNWFIGIKNGKWIGTKEKFAEQKKEDLETPIEKTWQGLISYAKINKDHIFLIHRGFETEDKGKFRAKPLHSLAKRIKKRTNIKLLFDPSHSFGPKLKDSIVEGTIDAMKLKLDENNYLYDGVLIEVGKSKTDTEQHISINELKQLICNLSRFRKIQTRK